VALDLQLEISPGGVPGMYAVAVDSPAGAAAGTMRLDTGGLLSRRRELAASVLASTVTTTRAGLSSALEGPVREVGEALFAAVFADRVYGRYTASLHEAARCGAPLRVVLRLRAPELAALPWETLFDPEAGEYLCQREPVVRYVETAQLASPLLVDPPLRILGVIAAPCDLPRLDVAEEKRRLTDALADLTRRRQVEVVWAPGGSWPVLQQQLLSGPWHVVHYIGHGGTDLTSGNGQLALEDETTGQAVMVSAGRFARLLHTLRPVPQLVVLNSCQSGEAAADDVLSSTAAALVHSGISAAVAMQFAITDPAALAFARGFYEAIASNNPVDEAVRNGRIAIDGTGERTLEWVTPVLYLRTDDTRLFDLPVRGPSSDSERGPVGWWRNRPRRLARAIAFSASVTVLGLVIALLFIFVFPHPRPVQPEMVPLTKLAAGDCMQTPQAYAQNTASRQRYWSSSTIPWDAQMPIVPCESAHSGEVFFADRIWSASHAYPGQSTVQQQWSNRCDTEFNAYVGVPAGNSTLAYTGNFPNKASWDDGDREVFCAAYDPTGEEIQGSIRGSRR